MKPTLLCWLGLLGAAAVCAQVAPVTSVAGGGEGLSAIEATRARESATLDVQEADCYQRFAISGCLKEVHSRRRAMLARLRREEAVLHEQEAAERGAEQRARSQQKAAERQQLEAQLRADNAAGNRAQALQAQQQKQAEHAARAATAPASPSSDFTVTALPGGPSPTEQAANRERLARKQAEAQKKRQELAKRQADKAGKTATPLPVPK